MKDTGLAGIVVKLTPELLKTPGRFGRCRGPFTVETGTSAEFVTTQPRDARRRTILPVV